jgi:hypothetical protein
MHVQINEIDAKSSANAEGAMPLDVPQQPRSTVAEYFSHGVLASKGIYINSP